ncbi:protein kinase [Streptomyces sp. SP17BM10]|uniref:serine/threonine protein kinase n=1 Tax=Streptomyces sp. SP17BM10 TaxID=3002530 RepID=UPI002E784C7A|nr:protein kinase [Streptomyces sp. SP17BM10]MEE1788744.1 protein kinase [Streptomyces sp. SP17BM10]
MRGTTLGDRYRLDEWLGGGSMGDVWLAEDEVLGRRVAVKVLKPALLDEPGFAERFHEEARVMARLRHPGIVGVHDFGSGRLDGGHSWTTAWGSTGRPIAYLVMELIDGEPLSDVLKRRGRLDAPETLGLALQVLEALTAAHEAGVVHRDIKPDNLMVREERVVIADFGIARPGCDTRLTVPGMVLGTAAYQAPEQASTGAVSAAADLYALGVVLYECLSGQLPYHGQTALEVILKHLTTPVPPLPADVPAPVRALVARAMAKDPAERWPDAATMAAAARAALDGEPVDAVEAAAPVAPSGTAIRTAARPVMVAAAAPTGTRPAAGRLRAALRGRRRLLIAAGVLALCSAITAATATTLGRDAGRATADAALAGGGPTAAVQPTVIPLADVSRAPTGTGTPSPSAPTAPGSPLPTAPGAPMGPVPVGGQSGIAGAGGTGRAGSAGSLPDAPSASNAPGRPPVPGPAVPAPSPSAVAPGPAYTPGPVVPGYRTGDPGGDQGGYQPGTPSDKPTTTAPKPPYTAAPPPPPPDTNTAKPPVRPPTEGATGLPPYGRLTNRGLALTDQNSGTRNQNPVVQAPDTGAASVWQLVPRQDGGGYFLNNGATGYQSRLDASNETSQAQIWASPSYSVNQVWSFMPTSGGYLLALTGKTWLCLTGKGPNVPAVVGQCTGGADQVWAVAAV